MDTPKISIIIPTLNSAGTLADCLASIRRQNYPAEMLEIILVDGGSSDDTYSIAQRYEVTKILRNPLQTGEAGKAVGLRAASHPFVALIDSDNILVDTDWFQKMVAPFADARIVVSEPLSYTHRKCDPSLTRYCALIGMNDPICYYLGNYDRWCAISNRWTEMEVKETVRDGYLLVELHGDEMPTIGANGAMFRRNALAEAGLLEGDYFFDIDAAYRLVQRGQKHVAKVDTGIVHLFASRFRSVIRKHVRRIVDYRHHTDQRQRSYPWRYHFRKRGMRLALASLLIAPILLDTLRGFLRHRDAAWLWHPPMLYLSLVTYAVGWCAHWVRPRSFSRATWQR